MDETLYSLFPSFSSLSSPLSQLFIFLSLHHLVCYCVSSTFFCFSLFVLSYLLLTCLPPPCFLVPISVSGMTSHLFSHPHIPLFQFISSDRYCGDRVDRVHQAIMETAESDEAKLIAGESQTSLSSCLCVLLSIHTCHIC